MAIKKRVQRVYRRIFQRNQRLIWKATGKMDDADFEALQAWLRSPEGEAFGSQGKPWLPADLGDALPPELAEAWRYALGRAHEELRYEPW